MKPLKDLAPDLARKIEVVFTDIDDTLTKEGLLEGEAFSAIWSLHKASVAVVPVTGRPAGWCDHIARMWPVAGVVGENGAFYFRYDRDARRLVRRFVLEEEERRHLQDRLAKVRDRVLREVPRARIASDQDYRIHDLAVDFCEDVTPPLPREEIDHIVEVFRDFGATAKVSSIHVNGWFGSYDKLGMIRTFASEVLAIDLGLPAGLERAAYVGDSPNDEPAFAFFSTAIGVANVRAFADRLQHPPAYVTKREGGAGFAELARHLLKSRA
jgi:HAD superfamily hydrolase (TIGR01484 family)